MMLILISDGVLPEQVTVLTLAVFIGLAQPAFEVLIQL